MSVFKKKLGWQPYVLYIHELYTSQHPQCEDNNVSALHVIHRSNLL